MCGSLAFAYRDAEGIWLLGWASDGGGEPSCQLGHAWRDSFSVFGRLSYPPSRRTHDFSYCTLLIVMRVRLSTVVDAFGADAHHSDGNQNDDRKINERHQPADR